MPFAFHTVPASDAPNGPKLLKSKPVRAAHARVAHDRTVRCGEGVQPTKTRGAARRGKAGKNVGVPQAPAVVSASAHPSGLISSSGTTAYVHPRNRKIMKSNGGWHSQQPQKDIANRAGLIPVAIESRGDSQLVPHRMSCGKQKQTECRGVRWWRQERCGTGDPGVCEPSFR